MKSAKRFILFFVCSGSLGFATENFPVKSNREVFFALSDSIAATLADDQLQNISTLIVKTSNDTFTNYFRQQFITRLMSKKKSLFEYNSSPVEKLDLTVVESSVTFGEIFTETFFGVRKVERKIVLSVNATITLSDGKILFSDQISSSSIDTVKFSDIEQMNNSSLPISNFQKPELSFFDSLIEPAIVIFSTGVAVYLFFTIRS